MQDVISNPWFWYYTLSAIPQALGAMIALTAMFVVYKVSRVSDRSEREKETVKRFLLILHPDKEIHDIESMRSWDVLHALEEGIRRLDPAKGDLGFTKYKELEKLMKEIASEWQRSFPVDAGRVYEFLQQKAHVFHRLVAARSAASRYLVNGLILSAIPSILSFLILPHITFFGASANQTVTLLTVLASLSIFYTAYSVWRIAKL